MNARFPGIFIVCLIFLFVPQLFAEDVQPFDTGDDFNDLVKEFDEFWANRPMEKGKGFKPFKRIQAFTEFREDQYGNFNPWAIREAWEQRQAMTNLDELDNNSDWSPLGPFQPYPGSYVGGMGRVNAIDFHPTDPNIFYVGAATGGLWRTINGGQSWEPLTDNIPVLGISDVIVDPQNPDTLWIATGDRDGARRRIPTYTVGILMSPDGGQSWENTALNFELSEENVVTALAMDPANPDVLIALTLDGIWRTGDRGLTWTWTQTTGLFYDIEIRPDDPSIIFASAAQDGIYRSLDGGHNWLELTAGLPSNGFNRIELAIAPSNPDRIYALYANDLAPFYTGFYAMFRSDDGGDTWVMRADSPNILGWDIDDNGTGGQGWFALTMAVDPEDEDVVWTGSVNIWKSIDGGDTWNTATYWVHDNGLPYIHADHHILKFRDMVLYSGNDGGIYRYSDLNDEWTDQSYMLAISQVYRLGSYQGSEDVELIITGNQDNGSKQYDEGDWRPILGGDGFDGGIDPVNNQIQYGSIYYGDFYRSLDGGDTWNDMNFGVNSPAAWITPFVIDTTVAGRLFRGHRGVFKSNNWGDSWDGTNQLTIDYIRAVAVAPSDTSRVYACDWLYTFFASDDGGESFSSMFFPGMKPTYLAVAPDNPEKVYATNGLFMAGAKVFVTEDAGVSWNNITGDLPNIPFNCIVIDPDRPQHIYLGSDLGVYFSADAGETWEQYNMGLPNVIVNELEIHRNSGTLLAGTFGRGTWRSPIEGDETSVAEVELVPSTWTVTALYPNPFNSSAVAHITVPESGTLTVNLYNMLGQRVRTLYDGSVGRGVYSINVQADGLASGAYILHANVPGKLNDKQRVILLR
jgi:photosystem II stability/assembly factor-like uncharacterized protein